MSYSFVRSARASDIFGHGGCAHEATGSACRSSARCAAYAIRETSDSGRPVVATGSGRTACEDLSRDRAAACATQLKLSRAGRASPEDRDRGLGTVAERGQSRVAVIAAVPSAGFSPRNSPRRASRDAVRAHAAAASLTVTSQARDARGAARSSSIRVHCSDEMAGAEYQGAGYARRRAMALATSR